MFGGGHCSVAAKVKHMARASHRCHSCANAQKYLTLRTVAHQARKKPWKALALKLRKPVMSNNSLTWTLNVRWHLDWTRPKATPENIWLSWLYCEILPRHRGCGSSSSMVSILHHSNHCELVPLVLQEGIFNVALEGDSWNMMKRACCCKKAEGVSKGARWIHYVVSCICPALTPCKIHTTSRGLHIKGKQSGSSNGSP